MKKMTKCLAVLSVIIAASLSTSCNKVEQIEPATSSRTVSITIAPPSSSATKVTTNDDGVTKLAITGWALGDEVYVGDVVDDEFVSSIFTCTNAAKGIFTGELPEGFSDVDEIMYAFYNIDGQIIYDDDYECIDVFPANMISTDPAGVVVMVAIRDENDAFNMMIAGNILKATNEGDPINVLMCADEDICDPCVSVYPGYDAATTEIGGDFYRTDFAYKSYTIPSGVSYIYLPMYNSYNAAIGFVTAIGFNVVEPKELMANGAIFTATIATPEGSEYEDFLGDWYINNFAITDTYTKVTIEEKTKGESYTIKDYLSLSGKPMFEHGITDIEAIYDAGNKCLMIMEQDLGEFESEGYNLMATLSGTYILEGNYYPAYPVYMDSPSRLAHGVVLEDGNISMSASKCIYGPFTSIGAGWYETGVSDKTKYYGSFFRVPDTWYKVLPKTDTIIESSAAVPTGKKPFTPKRAR